MIRFPDGTLANCFGHLVSLLREPNLFGVNPDRLLYIYMIINTVLRFWILATFCALPAGQASEIKNRAVQKLEQAQKMLTLNEHAERFQWLANQGIQGSSLFFDGSLDSIVTPSAISQVVAVLTKRKLRFLPPDVSARGRVRIAARGQYLEIEPTPILLHPYQSVKSMVYTAIHEAFHIYDLRYRNRYSSTKTYRDIEVPVECAATFFQAYIAALNGELSLDSDYVFHSYCGDYFLAGVLNLYQEVAGSREPTIMQLQGEVFSLGAGTLTAISSGNALHAEGLTCDPTDEARQNISLLSRYAAILYAIPSFYSAKPIHVYAQAKGLDFLFLRCSDQNLDRSFPSSVATITTIRVLRNLLEK